VEGISLGLYTFKEYKTKKNGSPDKVIDGFTILVESNKEYVAIKDATKASEILNRAVYLVRDLVSRPANSATLLFWPGQHRLLQKSTDLNAGCLELSR